MTFKPRPEPTRLPPRSSDANLVRAVLTSPGVLPSSQPEGSPFRWSEIVAGACVLARPPPQSVAYLKQRLVRGLRQMAATGEVERMGWGRYRLRPLSPTALELLSELSTRVACLKSALTASPSTVPPWLAENEWYFLRDRFKDVALGVERELMKAGRALELPTTVRVTEGSDGQPANRRLEVRFQARMIEGADSVARAIAEGASDSRIPGVTSPPVQIARITMGPRAGPRASGPERPVRMSGPSARQASRSTRRQTPTRRRAASPRPRPGRPARAASRST